MFNDEKMYAEISTAEQFIDKKYLDELTEYQVEDFEEHEKSYRFIRLYRIAKIVFDKEEDSNNKLAAVFQAVLPFCSSVVLLLKGETTYAELYLGVRSGNNIGIAGEVLQDSFLGNFPGSRIEAVSRERTENLFKDYGYEDYSECNISAINTIPALKGGKEKEFVQGLEKFIDTMKGTEYLCEILAETVSKESTEKRISGFEQLFSALYPFSKKTMSHGHNEGQTLTEGISESISDSISTGISLASGSTSSVNQGMNKSFNLGAHMLLGFGFGTGTSSGTSYGTSVNESESRTASKQSMSGRNRSESLTSGTTDSMTIEYKNKNIDNLLEKVEKHLKRLKDGASYGIWEGAAYFIAKEKKTAVIAASTFSSLITGDMSGIENSHFSIFGNELPQTKKVWEYLKFCKHPRFSVPMYSHGGEGQKVAPTTCINGRELTLLMALPRKSVTGVMVTEMAEFGRNIIENRKSGKTVQLGNIYHMGEVESNPLEINLENLTAHCFVTGSTGSGKSNTVYHMIEKISLSEVKIPFLVIEPAKGEYRNEFRNVPGIHLFTTNPWMDQLLKINPFSFCEGIHILEHLDRLIEIFNTCWEMYAAMPAILKEAIEQAYVSKGWDLMNSVYMKNGEAVYPTFADVLKQLPKIINSSQYSSDTKGDYIGALVTRVSSMTNGIYGQIFCDEFEIEEKALFDENTVVDLSRVGSSETKSLIMGILVLKLTEYRIAHAGGSNLGLEHITVLEEAHNLLKNVENVAGTAGNSIVSKSVEMIVNSIAEMRTYGEGFIIVDQSPTAVDIAAIKNTNTKIVMRLPEKEDCKLAGYALSLKEQQIEELPKLETGVAVVMQNNWNQAVLGKVDRASSAYAGNSENVDFVTMKRFKSTVIAELLNQFVKQDEGNVEKIYEVIDRYEITTGKKEEMKRIIGKLCRELQEEFNSVLLGRSLLGLTGCNEAFAAAEDKLKLNAEGMIEGESLSKWGTQISHSLDQYVALQEEHREILLQYILHAKRFEEGRISYEQLYREIYKVR